MTLTATVVADEFIAAAAAAGLKKVIVLVGKIGDGEFVVTLSMVNPVAAGAEAQFLASSRPHEFIDRAHVKETAIAKAARFARATPTIH